MIKAITIENFKGISQPVRVELKPITLLFGANSAGKSTIIQAIHYIREIMERQNFDADQTIAGGDFIDLGGFRNFVHNRDITLPIRFRIEMDLETIDVPRYLTEFDEIPIFTDCDWNLSHKIKSAWVGLAVIWNNEIQRAQLTEYETGINGQPLGRISLSERGRRVRISHINFEHPIFPLEDLYNQVIKVDAAGNNELLELGLLGQKSALPTWGDALIIEKRCIADPKDSGEEFGLGEDDFDDSVRELTTRLSQLLVGPGEVLAKALGEFRYVGPLRKVPPRGYVPLKAPANNRWADGMAAWDRLYERDVDFVNHVSDWMSDAKKLNSGYRLKMRLFREVDSDNELAARLLSNSKKAGLSRQFSEIPEKKELLLQVEKGDGITVALQDIGVGISQILPVVVAALDDENMLVMIEQPELHIHPKLQVNLGDLFINQIQNTSCGNQIFLLETHSEHLLLRLLRRIRETSENELPLGAAPLTPEQLSVLYVEQSSQGFQLRYLEINEYGDSKGEWPIGFFGERAEELF